MKNDKLIFLVFLLLVPLLDLAFTSYWVSNDDVAFYLITKGKIFSNEPSYLIRHIHVWWGMLIIQFNQLSSNFNWHGVFSHLLIQLSAASFVIGFYFNEKSSKVFILKSFIIVTIYFVFVTSLQFTTTSIFVTGCGYYLFSLKLKSRVKENILLLFACILLLIGFFIRVESFLLATAIYVLYTAVNKNFSIIRMTREHLNAVKFILLFFLAFAVIAEKNSYSSEEWEKYTKNNLIKSYIMDYGGINILFKENIRNRLNLSELDLHMARSWIFDDNIADKFKDIEQILIDEGRLSSVEHLQSKLNYNVRYFKKTNRLFFFLLLLAIPLLAINSKNRRTILRFYLLVIGLFVYLFFFKKMPERVWMSYIFATYIFSSSIVSDLNIGKRFWLTMVLVLVFSVPLYYSQIKDINIRQERQSKLVEDLTIINSLPQNIKILVWANNYPYELVSTVKKIENYLPNSDLIQIGGGHSLTPYYEKIKKTYLLNTPRFDFFRRDDILMFASESHISMLTDQFGERFSEESKCSNPFASLKLLSLWRCIKIP